MGQYTHSGLYNSYDKNNKERDALDYYSTPPKEVTNILNYLQLDFLGKTILEPCVGGGHMFEGIKNYRQDYLILEGSDVKDRGFVEENVNYGEKYNFLSDSYPNNKADIIVMNPPFSCIEGFVIRALEIAPVVLMLGRSQFAEGKNRYENIFKDNPPNKIIQYVDRIACWRNGTKPEGSSAQSYSWFLWDRTTPYDKTVFEWIRRA